ncbi:hypothetical protein AB833_22645 [Chromatiales bacterium (ex Bugula neritina AB1)]|nr:hypothetical protein AB833_22645 [Chromatiales bacterium (ex Bugula neritina AB1)]
MAICAAISILLSTTFSYSSTRFDFSEEPILISGSELAEGAVYRFDSVVAGLDAIVEVVRLRGVLLLKIDDENRSPLFQPVLKKSGINARADFRFSFVDSVSGEERSVSTAITAIDYTSMPLIHSFGPVSHYRLAEFDAVSGIVSEPGRLSVTESIAPYSNLNGSDPVSAEAGFASMYFHNIEGIDYSIQMNGDDTAVAGLSFSGVEIDSPYLYNINDNPLARADKYTVEINRLLLVDAARGVLKNDSDIDLAIDDDHLTIKSFTVDGTIYVAGATAQTIEGDLSLFGDGSLRFLPAINFTGVLPLVEYELVDGNGGSAVGELSLSVNGVNSAPVAQDDSIALGALQPLLVDVLANDSDIDGNLAPETLRIVADVAAFPAGTILSDDGRLLSVSGEGSWLVNGDSQLVFIPMADTSDNKATGVVTAIDYQIQDTHGSRSIASVVLQNDSQAGFEVSISEDTNNDGFISQSELSGLIDVTVQLPNNAQTGDTIRISAVDIENTVQIDIAEKDSGIILSQIPVPADGELISLSAVYISASGEIESTATDTATLDITANDAAVVFITTDADNSGFVSASETQTDIIVEVILPVTVSVGDTVSINNGTTTEQIVLAPLDLAEGKVVARISNVAEGETLAVKVQITDAAGNRSAIATDSALLDTVSPPIPHVTSVVSNSGTPVISGGHPVDSPALLTVTVNEVIYASGDGQLVKGGDGTWQLAIPPSDALTDGTYDVVAMLTDMAGNSSNDSTLNELTIDLLSPVLEIQVPGTSTDPAPLLTGTTDQPFGAVVTVRDSEGRYLCDAVVAELAWSCRVQRQLIAGTTALTVSTQDEAGNITRVDVDVRVAEGTDSDADGIPDDIEGTGDFDGDGVANYLDLDSDNDSIIDSIESATDQDGDGNRNYVDPDSDNDGIADLVESGVASLPDSDSDGIFDAIISVGSNGLADLLEGEAEGDVATTPRDSDGDGVFDYLDLDSDNDSIADSVENGYQVGAGGLQRQDGNIVPVLDTDNDGVPNYRDIDSDQDGISDISEAKQRDNDNDRRVDGFIDTDVNGLADMLTGLAPDLDRDQLADFLDTDSDGDGLSDLLEAGGIDLNNDGIHDTETDANANGIVDTIDSAVTLGEDADTDGIDDLYDSDFANGTDSDGDGIIDSHDSDANGDGMIDRLFNDTVPLPDTNNNGVADAFEPVVPEVASLIQTGTGGFGGGCSIRDDENRQVDVALASLFLMSLLGIFRRRVPR